MRLVTVHQWRERHFEPESAPTDLTVLRLLRDGKLPGRKVGGKWFIDEAEWLAEGDELMQRVLSG